MNKIIEIKNLKKVFKIEIKQNWFFNRINALFKPKYKIIEAVSGINFEVQAWEKIAFLWPNWAGKSTTIKMLTWILQYTEWKINVCGYDPSKNREKLVYKIGAVFGQTSRLWYHLTPFDTFKLFWKIFDIENLKLNKRLDYLINKFKINDLINIPVRKLSLWQRMKCEIVASLIHSPKILFLDEPTIGLDIIAKQNLREIINDINEIEGTTIFLTSHDLGDIENICKRIVIINNWKILYDWNLKELRRNYIKIKNIRVKFDNTNKKFVPLKFMKLKKQKWDFIEFEIPNNKENLAKTFTLLTDKYEIEDVTIEDPKIEEIIKQFY